MLRIRDIYATTNPQAITILNSVVFSTKTETLTNTIREILYTHERGECIYEYVTQNIEDAVFYILYDIIRIIIEKIIWDKYVDDNQCLNYNDEINNERKRLSCEAFEKIGGNYEKWYRGGRIPFKK